MRSVIALCWWLVFCLAVWVPEAAGIWAAKAAIAYHLTWEKAVRP